MQNIVRNILQKRMEGVLINNINIAIQFFVKYRLK